jgi:hypothetical protein
VGVLLRSEFCDQKASFCQKRDQQAYDQRQKIAKAKRRQGYKEKEMYMAAWLKRFAKSYGDQLPFGDFEHDTEIRLPYIQEERIEREHDTNLSIECLQRTLLKYQQLNVFFFSSFTSSARQCA